MANTNEQISRFDSFELAEKLISLQNEYLDKCSTSSGEEKLKADLDFKSKRDKILSGLNKEQILRIQNSLNVIKSRIVDIDHSLTEISN
jgi:hypothetical protein